MHKNMADQNNTINSKPSQLYTVQLNLTIVVDLESCHNYVKF